jgi:tetratricopeptide (TPR) repeat protein
MPELLRALRRGRDLKRRRLRLAVGLGALGIAGTAAVLLSGSRGAPTTPCTDGEARIARVWNPARAAQALAALHAADRPRIGAALDDYARRWALAHRDACLATRVSGSQSEAMLDRRAVCLDRIASVLDAGLDVVAGPGGADAADSIVSGLPDLAACAQVASLSAEDPPPSPSARPILEAAMRAVAAGTYAANQGDPRAPALTQHALELARTAGWRPELARALDAVATARWQQQDHDGAIAALREAVELALASRSDGIAAIALADLARNLSTLARAAEAQLALDMAISVLDRITDIGPREAVALARVQLALDAERFDDAVAAAAALNRLVEDASPHHRVAARMKLSEVFEIARRPEDMLAHARAAHAQGLALYGADHPLVVAALRRVALGRMITGDAAGAAADTQAVIAAIERRHGAHSPALADALRTLGELARRGGDAEAAAGHWTRALAVLPDVPATAADRGMLHLNLAIIELEAGRHEAGLRQCERGLPLLEAALGADSPALTDALVTRGYALRGLGRIDQARADIARAVDLARRGYGPNHPSTTGAQIELGATLLAAGEDEATIALLAPLVAIADDGTAGRPPIQAIEARLHLASARWRAGQRAAAGRLLAEAAGRAAGDPGLAAMVDAWRAAHR